jgi:hypothetical protein
MINNPTLSDRATIKASDLPRSTRQTLRQRGKIWRVFVCSFPRNNPSPIPNLDRKVRHMKHLPSRRPHPATAIAKAFDDRHFDRLDRWMSRIDSIFEQGFGILILRSLSAGKAIAWADGGHGHGFEVGNFVGKADRPFPALEFIPGGEAENLARENAHTPEKSPDRLWMIGGFFGRAARALILLYLIGCFHTILLFPEPNPQSGATSDRTTAGSQSAHPFSIVSRGNA